VIVLYISNWSRHCGSSFSSISGSSGSNSNGGSSFSSISGSSGSNSNGSIWLSLIVPVSVPVAMRAIIMVVVILVVTAAFLVLY